MMGTEGGTWRDEHWVLCYMLANRTPIKNIQKKSYKKKVERVTKHERLLTLGNKQGVVEGEVGRELG